MIFRYGAGVVLWLALASVILYLIHQSRLEELKSAQLAYDKEMVLKQAEEDQSSEYPYITDIVVTSVLYSAKVDAPLSSDGGDSRCEFTSLNNQETYKAIVQAMETGRDAFIDVDYTRDHGLCQSTNDLIRLPSDGKAPIAARVLDMQVISIHYEFVLDAPAKKGSAEPCRIPVKRKQDEEFRKVWRDLRTRAKNDMEDAFWVRIVYLKDESGADVCHVFRAYKKPLVKQLSAQVEKWQRLTTQISTPLNVFIICVTLTISFFAFALVAWPKHRVTTAFVILHTVVAGLVMYSVYNWASDASDESSAGGKIFIFGIAGAILALMKSREQAGVQMAVLAWSTLCVAYLLVVRDSWHGEAGELSLVKFASISLTVTALIILIGVPVALAMEKQR